WATEVEAASSRVRAGSAGRYRSIEKGPNTVSSSRIHGRARGIAGATGAGGMRFTAGRSSRGRRWPTNDDRPDPTIGRPPEPGPARAPLAVPGRSGSKVGARCQRRRRGDSTPRRHLPAAVHVAAPAAQRGGLVPGEPLLELRGELSQSCPMRCGRGEVVLLERAHGALRPARGPSRGAPWARRGAALASTA